MSERWLPDLPPRGKEPNSKRNLDAWIEQAASRAGILNSRLGWLVGSSVVIAALQRARHTDGGARFLLKGGAWLELRLGLHARATADIDVLFRGDFDDFLDTLDDALAAPWGALELQRGQIDTIDRAQRLVKPRRFDIRLQVRGRTWRRIQVEVSPDEGGAGARSETAVPPALDHFGLPSPVELAGIVMDYQVAQKLHACTDPHDPPTQINDRVRDLADLLLIRDTFHVNAPDLHELQTACRDVFSVRADEARQLGAKVRPWPPTIQPHAHWNADWAQLAAELNLHDVLDTAVTDLNRWIARIQQG